MTRVFTILLILPTAPMASAVRHTQMEFQDAYPEARMLTWVPSQGEKGWRGMAEPNLIVVDSAVTEYLYRHSIQGLDNYEREVAYMKQRWPRAIWLRP